jgi:hypothetical protein
MHATIPRLGSQAFLSAKAFNANIGAWNVLSVGIFLDIFDDPTCGLADCFKHAVYYNWGPVFRGMYPFPYPTWPSMSSVCATQAPSTATPSTATPRYDCPSIGARVWPRARERLCVRTAPSRPNRIGGRPIGLACEARQCRARLHQGMPSIVTIVKWVGLRIDGY